MTFIRVSLEEKKKYNILAKYVANGTIRIIEPFAHFAYFSILCCMNGFKGDIVLNFNDNTFARLFEFVLDNPYYLIDYYEELWSKQFKYENEDYYYCIKNEYETSDLDKRSALLVFLLQKGNSNFVEYKRSYGKSPNDMRNVIKYISVLLKGRTVITANDNKVFSKAIKGDAYFIDNYDDSLKEGISDIMSNGASYIVYPKRDLSEFQRAINNRGKRIEEFTGKSYFLFYT